MIGTVLHRLHGGLDFGDRRDHQDLDQAIVFLDDAKHFEAADAGQPHVEQHQIDVFAIQNRERGLAARYAQDAVLTLQNGRECVAHPLVVVDDEDRFWLMGHRLAAKPARIVSGG